MWLGTMSLASRMPRAAARSRSDAPRVLAAQVGGDGVVVQRVGGRGGVGVAAELLDALRGAAALPQPDQPQARDAERREPVELLVGHLVEAA